MRIVIFLQKPKWNSIFGMVGNAVSLSDRWSFREIYMWEDISAAHGKKGKGPVTFQPRIWSILELHYSHNHLVIIKLNCFLCHHVVFLSPAWNCVDLWVNQWVTAEVNLFATKTDRTQKYLWRKIFWKYCVTIYSCGWWRFISFSVYTHSSHYMKNTSVSNSQYVAT